MGRTRSVLLAGALILLAATPASAQERTATDDDFVVFTGKAVVAGEDTVGSVVIFNGPAQIDGTTRESVIAFNGDVTVSGTVGGEVIAFNGPVTIRSGATVESDVISRSSIHVEPGATVRGKVEPNSLRFVTDPQPFLSRLLFWLAVSVSTLLLGLLFLFLAPRAADALSETWRTALSPAILWGIALFIGLPIVAVLVSLTLVGIPFGIGLLLAHGLIYGMGYVISAWVLGRGLLGPPRGRFASFLAGWAILRVVALVPFLGGAVWAVASLFGLGLAVVAIWRTRYMVEAAPA